MRRWRRLSAMEAYDQMAEIKKKQDALVKKKSRLTEKAGKRGSRQNTVSIGENEIAEVVARMDQDPGAEAGRGRKQSDF